MSMTEIPKQRRRPSDKRQSQPPLRQSHADVIDNLERWANSAGLQPPRLEAQK